MNSIYKKAYPRIAVTLLLWIMGCITLLQAADSHEASFRKLEYNYTLLPDGSQELHFHKELTIFTHTAMNSTYGESFVVYNPAYQELVINESYTRQKDGHIVRTPANALVKQLPGRASDAPAYSELVEMVVVHTGLELGATIVLDYTLKSRPEYLGELDVCEPLQQSSAVENCKVTFTLPSEKKPCISQLTLTNGKELAPTLHKEGSNQIYSWTLKNIPASSHQDAEKPAYIVAFSSFADSKESMQYLLNQFDTNESPLVNEKAMSLAKGKSTSETVAAFVHYVADQLDGTGLRLSDIAYRIRPADEVIRTAYGSEVEKANLLAALLQAVHIPYTVNWPRSQGSSAATLSQIQLVYVVVNVNGKEYPIRASIGSLGLYSQLRTPMKVVTETTLTPGEKIAAVSNAKVPYALLNLSEALKAKEEYVNSTDTIRCTTDSIGAGYEKLTLPAPSHAASALSTDAVRLPSQRSETYVLPYPSTDEVKYHLILPADKQLASKEYTIRRDNAYGTIELSLKKTEKGAEVVRALTLRQTEIPVKAYTAFRELIGLWNDISLQTILLKNGK